MRPPIFDPETAAAVAAHRARPFGVVARTATYEAPREAVPYATMSAVIAFGAWISSAKSDPPPRVVVVKNGEEWPAFITGVTWRYEDPASIVTIQFVEDVSGVAP